MDTIKLPPYPRWYTWMLKKQAQVIVRAHLSDILALVLAVLVVIRERTELLAIGAQLSFGQWVLLLFLVAATAVCVTCAGLVVLRPRRRWPLISLACALLLIVLSCYFRGTSLLAAVKTVGCANWLIIVVIIGTVGAAVWEFFGNKLTSSPQEIRFAAGIRGLLDRTERYKLDVRAEADKTKRNTLLENLLPEFLELSGTTLCGNKKVTARLMLLVQDNLEWTSNSKTNKIPLPTEDTDSGPAGWSMKTMKLAYVPDKDWKESWLFKAVQNEYEVSPSPQSGWIDVDSTEPLHSVLCVPISVYSGSNQRTKIGVLNFSTESRDPFVPRDFLMAECFASILSQALGTA
jgi:hypothetical protein